MLRSPTEREIGALESLTDYCGFKVKAQHLYDTVNHLCDGRGFHALVVFGARTEQEQIDLYSIGRIQVSKNPLPYGLWVLDKVKTKRRPVTRALPDQSAHCYAAAIDLALVDDKLNTWLSDSHPAWGDIVRDEAVKLGLESGHEWRAFRDSAHVELPDWKRAAQHGKIHMVGRP